MSQVWATGAEAEVLAEVVVAEWEDVGLLLPGMGAAGLGVGGRGAVVVEEEVVVAVFGFGETPRLTLLRFWAIVSCL